MENLWKKPITEIPAALLNCQFALGQVSKGVHDTYFCVLIFKARLLQMLCFAKDKVHFQIQMIAESSITVLLPMEKKLTITHAHLINHFSMQLYNLVSSLQVRVLLDLIFLL